MTPFYVDVTLKIQLMTMTTMNLLTLISRMTHRLTVMHCSSINVG